MRVQTAHPFRQLAEGEACRHIFHHDNYITYDFFFTLAKLVLGDKPMSERILKPRQKCKSKRRITSRPFCTHNVQSNILVPFSLHLCHLFSPL